MSIEGPAVILGLGNPGEEYAQTRHNVGFMVLKALERRHHIDDRKGYPLATLHRGRIGALEVVTLRPKTYMNLSGQAAAWFLKGRQIPPSRMLVLTDDFALPLGRLRVRPSGSAGGHNGLKSLISDLGTQEFPRVRLGVGPVPERWDPADFVLGRFRADEQKELDEMIERCCDCVETWLTQPFEIVMSRFNPDPRKPPPEPKPPRERPAATETPPSEPPPA